ncbi:tape measure protein [Petroclostridium xylanilyticum]|uniref:tape measure protein n=1 Tax=Petroclostridium xylanilyticum TaxID=1792311 RepID=UPI000B98824B|nr:tape measure protein [Petroclostridium xylanilyticum]
MPTLEAVFRINDRYTSAINKIMASTTTAENKLKAISNTTDIFNKKLSDIKTGASFGIGGITSLVGALKGLAAAYLTVQAAKKGMEISDNYTNTAARLKLINDGLQTNAELQDKIFKAAERSRGSYTAMADSVAKMGLLAKDAFTGNDELIAFTELVQKSFKVGGASAQEQQAGLYQLTQAMAAGKLQGDEFRSIMENAPMIADAIAKFTGKSKGELKKMSADGVITADIIKNAMFKASEDINKKFETMPRTFGDVFAQFGNKALKAFEPVIQKVNKAINSPAFISFTEKLMQGINFVAGGVGILIDGFIWVGNVIQSNWEIIEPVLIAIGAALTAWAVIKIPFLIGRINLLIIKLWLMLEPILAQAAAWMTANWPILLIGAAIGFLLYAMIKFGDTVVEVVGFVGGVFGVLFAFLYNKFAYFANTVVSIAEFFANVWIDPVYAVKKLFYDLSINALSFLTNIAKGIEKIINSIPGLNVNITGGMENLLDTLKAERDNLKSDKNVIRLKRFEQMDYSTAFDMGKDWGKKIGRTSVDNVQGAFNKLTSIMSFMTPKSDLDSGIDKYMKNGALPVTGKVDISEEDLRYLKDIAEREYINKYSTTTLAPNIRISFGNVTKEADVDKITGRIEKILKEQIAIAAEGSYA